MTRRKAPTNPKPPEIRIIEFRHPIDVNATNIPFRVESFSASYTLEEAIRASHAKNPLNDGYYLAQWRNLAGPNTYHIVIRYKEIVYLECLVPRLGDGNEILPNPGEVDHINPTHYKEHPSGVECIAVTRHMGFNLGNAVKYIWRAGEKVLPGETKEVAQIRDLEKAKWYLEDEITRLKKAGT